MQCGSMRRRIPESGSYRCACRKPPCSIGGFRIADHPQGGQISEYKGICRY